MNRISVVGTSGSGKTTFAGKLSEILGIPHVELDSLSWEAGWTPAPRDVFRSRVREAVNADRWLAQLKCADSGHRSKEGTIFNGQPDQ